MLINNAGVNIRGTVNQLTEADWDSVIDTNLKGPFLCSRAIGPGMVKRGWGRVINLGSILGAVALGGRAPYTSSKASVINLTQGARARVGGDRRDVECDLPGPFATEMNLPLLNDPVKYQGSSRRSRWADGASSTSSPARWCFSLRPHRHSLPARRCSWMGAGRRSKKR